MLRAICSPSARIQAVVGRPGSGKTCAASACVQAFAASGVPVVPPSGADEIDRE
ncbi:MAG: hypothetical protein HYX34_03885 [Actinobacteria bacterium]|nr:hypothetical protein [Actinomycetota bacterium]